MPISYENSHKIAKELHSAFERFNQEIILESKILNLSQEEAELVKANTALDTRFCHEIAKQIIDASGYLSEKTIGRYIKADSLPNSMIIDHSGNELRVIIKSRAKYKFPEHRKHLTHSGAFKVIKPYALLVTLNTLNLNMLITRIVTWSRAPAQKAFEREKEEFTHLERHEKIFQLQKATQAGHTKGFSEINFKDFSSDGKPVKGQIFFQEYKGLDLSAVQKVFANPDSYIHKTLFPNLNLFKGSIIFQYLQSLHEIISKNFWPSDLKLENTCIEFFNENTFRINIIDYDSFSTTYGLLSKLRNLRVYTQYLRMLREEPDRLNPQGFHFLRNELISEVLHVCYLFADWPNIIYLDSFRWNQDYNNTDLKPAFILPKLTPDLPNPITVFFFKIANSIDLNYTVTFADFLKGLHSVNIPWPREFNIEWINMFSYKVDAFFSTVKGLHIHGAQTHLASRAGRSPSPTSPSLEPTLDTSEEDEKSQKSNELNTSSSDDTNPYKK